MQTQPSDLPQLLASSPIKGAAMAGGDPKRNKAHPWRLALWRQWDSRLPMLAVVMLNPSTADAREDDYTISRLVGVASRHGYGGFIVANLFAFRATDPFELLRRGYLRCIGPNNDDWISAVCNGRDVLAAWGVGNYAGRADKVWRIIHPVATGVFSLGVNKDGSPAHPSRLSNSIKMQPWKPAKEAATNV